MALIRKRPLTQQQKRRIQQQQQRQHDQNSAHDLEGLVVQHYGRQLEVKVLSLPQTTPHENHLDTLESTPLLKPICLHDIWRCHTRTNLETLVTGDRVKWQADPVTGQGIITALYPRQSLLTRPDRYHKVKPVASNIDLIVVVFAPLPEVSPLLIDRYLVACANANIPTLLLMNKLDLVKQQDSILELLDEYQQLGYTTLSCHIHDDLTTLKQHLMNKTVVFVGQSGVGKSSLINALIPEAQQETNVISENSALGQHTTTSTRLIPLDKHSAIIDSPGIREFGLWHLNAQSIPQGFPDIQPYLGQCQFRNCTHTHEKKCALKDAVQQGQILPRRLESYLRLMAEVTESER